MRRKAVPSIMWLDTWQNSKNIPIDEHVPLDPTDASAFTDYVSRGKLTHPPQWLFSFAQVAYYIFENYDHQCLRRVMCWKPAIR